MPWKKFQNGYAFLECFRYGTLIQSLVDSFFGFLALSFNTIFNFKATKEIWTNLAGPKVLPIGLQSPASLPSSCLKHHESYYIAAKVLVQGKIVHYSA